ncbi:hypothetical protein EI94DRAFT_1741321 [Lactarius quietus]|nr:hypothetical protein EI94DRAFT_1741321 [Lactarius quietus]
MPQPSVQYPSATGPVSSAPAPTGQIASQLQMPLESPTRYVIHKPKHSSPARFMVLKNPITGLMGKNLTGPQYTNPLLLPPLPHRTWALFSTLR